MTTAAENRTGSAWSRTRSGLKVVLGTASVMVMATVAGCSADAPETQTEVSDVHLDAIRDIGDELEYKEVTVSGETTEIISPFSFAIGDPDDALVEDLLIVHQLDSVGINPVKVTGIVYRGFDVAEVEKETGIDLDEDLHQKWQGESYIVASEVEER